MCRERDMYVYTYYIYIYIYFFITASDAARGVNVNPMASRPFGREFVRASAKIYPKRRASHAATTNCCT